MAGCALEVGGGIPAISMLRLILDFCKHRRPSADCIWILAGGRSASERKVTEGKRFKRDSLSGWMEISHSEEVQIAQRPGAGWV